jgi:hypothetical protein
VGIQGAYPTYSLPGTKWVGKTVLHQPKCKCCGDDVAEELLELLVKRAAGRKVPGINLTLRGIPEYFQREGRGFSKQGLLNHINNHIVVAKVGRDGELPTVAPKPSRVPSKGDTQKRDQQLRDAVAGDEMEPSDAAVTKGSHMVFLEKVVKVAQHVVEQFPERVTPEMGIRAAAEIAKQRQNDSREALIDLLVATGSAGEGKVERVGPAAIVREIEGHTEEVEDAELVG